MLRAATKFPTFATVAQMNPAQKFNRISLCSSFSTLASFVFACVCVRHAESVSKSLAKRPGHNCHWASIQMSQIVCQIAHWTWNSFDSLICLPQLPFLLPIWRSCCGSVVCCSVDWPIGRLLLWNTYQMLLDIIWRQLCGRQANA